MKIITREKQKRVSDLLARILVLYELALNQTEEDRNEYIEKMIEKLVGYACEIENIAGFQGDMSGEYIRMHKMANEGVTENAAENRTQDVSI